ncbi:MAG: hypothetical protein ACPGVB_09815 [Chitinophagales bacterium]
METMANGTETLIHPKQQIIEGEPLYLPLKIFKEEFFNAEEELFYKTRFSLSLLLDKWRKKGMDGQSSIAAAATALIEEVELAFNEVEDQKQISSNFPAFEEALQLLFPSFFFEEQIGFVSVPFSKSFVFISQAFQERVESNDWEIKITSKSMGHASEKFTLEVAGFILNKFYGQDLVMCPSETMTLRNKKTKLERHYKINMVTDYIQATPLKPLKPLSQSQIQELLNNTENTDLYLEHIPPENFAFEGFFIGYLTDVTDVEVLSNMKALMVEEEAYTDMESQYKILNNLELQVRSYLNLPDLKVGCLQMLFGGWHERTSFSLFKHIQEPQDIKLFYQANETYRKVLKSHDIVIIDDLTVLSVPSELERILVQDGIRSLILAPLINSDGNISGIFELGINEPYRFSAVTAKELQEVISLFSTGLERTQRDVQKQVIGVLQEQFTAMHPSVAWRFNKAAYNYMFQKQLIGNQATIEPIVFQNIYPLYGQADIVGSSTLRNEAISADLIDNLKQVRKIMIAFKKKLHFHLLDMQLLEVKAHLDRLQSGDFISSDESQIIELLSKEIHPLLKHLSLNHPHLPKNLLQDYFNNLDSELKIVYCRRREYEESVRILNQTMSAYLEESDQKMQKILPHFFEKYKTDGVEYNIYLGESILQNGEFSDFYLKDFRLWQLINMCEITRLVAKTAPTLPIPLQTAQLIFVYNNSLSIRFRMDEKKFDVDGTYNVRYEILKKRIDKAVIKGTNERLTQKGKIAIVWLQEKDRQEYLKYLNHLYLKGYIEEDIEDLELEKLQGADGLKALRVTVREG